VTPAFDAFDSSALRLVTETSAWPYASFPPQSASFADSLLYADWGVSTWKFYRAWAAIRVLGRWPLAVFGAGDTPRCLDACPLCGAPDVEISHLLLSCDSCYDLRTIWLETSPLNRFDAVSLTWDLLRLTLFGSVDNGDFTQTAASIRFVGQCPLRAASSLPRW